MCPPDYGAGTARQYPLWFLRHSAIQRARHARLATAGFSFTTRPCKKK